jgi:ABC-type lipoprotein export system ATPase subunit
MSSAVLEGKGLWRIFERRGAPTVEVLRGVNLELRAGELVAVVGPSGAGKSTLLNCLTGIDRLTRGEVTVGGKNIGRMSEKELARLRHERFGLVFQFFHLLNDLSAIENVLLASRLYADRPVAGARQRAEKLLEMFGLAHRAAHHPAELSGGEMQRVAVARALMMDPPIVLCDEPTGNLDSANGQAIINTLAELARRDKKTVLIVTHDDRISGIADRVLRMKDGVL